MPLDVLGETFMWAGALLILLFLVTLIIADLMHAADYRDGKKYGRVKYLMPAIVGTLAFLTTLTGSILLLVDSLLY
jgi:hypothetical protein